MKEVTVLSTGGDRTLIFVDPRLVWLHIKAGLKLPEALGLTYARCLFLLLVTCMRLYMPLCLSIGWLVRRSVAVHEACNLWRSALFLSAL